MDSPLRFSGSQVQRARPSNRRWWAGGPILASAFAACGLPEPLPDDRGLEVSGGVVELDIAGIHAGLASGAFTCLELVEAYLARIEAYDRQGPALHAIVTVNPKAAARAREADARIDSAGLTSPRPLECVPMIVKDNYDTADLPTTAGSGSLRDSMPPDDAFQVRKIREAGAIVLAKANMAEFAFSPYETLGSIVPGHTRNPYDPYRVPAGSSGGTAAAVAASFGAVGLGTDTGNSIRGPSSHTALFGIRSTMGLTSRDGIVPLNLFRDIGGPMARTVEDAVRVFDVIAGPDPADTATLGTARESGYLAYLDDAPLPEFRIGVVRQLVDPQDTEGEIGGLFDAAVADLEALGAQIVDPVAIEGLELEGSLWCNPFRSQLDAYLESLGLDAPVESLAAIVESGDFHPSIAGRLETALEVEGSPEEECAAANRRARALREEVRGLYRELELDALVYPTWTHPPRLLGDLTSPDGNNSHRLSPPTGLPAVTVPMGFDGAGLPAGLQLLGDAFREGTLFRISYAYEQRTRHRQAPSGTPELPR